MSHIFIQLFKYITFHQEAFFSEVKYTAYHMLFFGIVSGLINYLGVRPTCDKGNL